MNLKNYTSSVTVLNSISKIEHRLAQAGTSRISKFYDKDRPIGMIFEIPYGSETLSFKLPAKADKVFQLMIRERRKPPTKTQLEAIRMQADRTAWKILSDWIELQISLIQVDQAEVTEIFLPYLYNNKKNETFYELMKKSNFLIGEGTKDGK